MEPPCLAFTGGGAPLGAHYCLSVCLSECVHVCVCVRVLLQVRHSLQEVFNLQSEGTFFFLCQSSLFSATLSLKPRFHYNACTFPPKNIAGILSRRSHFQKAASTAKCPGMQRFHLELIFARRPVRESNDIHAGLDKAAKPMDSSVFFFTLLLLTECH